MTTPSAFARTLRSALPVLLTAAFLASGTQHAGGQLFGYWNNNNGASWTTNNRWAFNAIPNGAGDIGIIIRNITADQTITLDGSRTVGYLNLGDTNLSTPFGYDIATGSGGNLIFDQGVSGGHAYLTRFAGANDLISADVTLNDHLVVITRQNNAARSLTLSGTLGGAGTLIAGAYSDGQLFITGNNSSSPVPIHIYQRGTSNLTFVPQVVFNAATGNAVGGGLTIGNATLTGNGNAILDLQEGRSNLDQIKDTIHVIGDGFNANNRRAFLRLNGGSETLGGVTDLGGGLVIENWSVGSSQSSPATLTIKGDTGTDSFLNGVVRNTAATTASNSVDDNVNNNGGADEFRQGDSAGSPSPFALSLVKDGPSTLTLSGNRIYYTGTTTVNGGTLVLNNTANFRSDIINNSALVMNQNSGTWNFRREFDGGGNENLQITGGGSLTKTGNGTLVINHASNVIGALRSEAGVLTFGGNNNVFSSITLGGDHGVNRDLNINGSATVNGPIYLRGNHGQTGSDVQIKGAITTNSTVTFAQVSATLSDNGSLSNPSSITLAGAPNETGGFIVGTHLILSNTSAANNTNRIGNNTVFNSMGGDFSFRNDGSDTAFSETIGALNLHSGALDLDTSRAGASGSSTLTFASLNRPDSGTVRFTGANLGEDARNQVRFTVAPTLTNGVMDAWATVDEDLATYGPNGVTAFTGYTTATSTQLTSATTNYLMTSGGNIGNNSSRDVYTLNLKGGGYTLSGGGTATLTVHGGLIIESGTGNKTLSFSNLTVGPGDNELILKVTGNSNRLMTINSTIANNGATPLRLVKTGEGVLRLFANNSFSGGLIINEGRVRITEENGLGAVPGALDADNIQLNGGVLHLDVGGSTISLSANRGITVSEAGGQIQVGTNNTSDPTFNIPGPINAAGVLELAVNGNPAGGKISTLNLGAVGRSDTYSRGIFAVGPYDGIINILGNNTIGTIEMEGSTMTLTGNNTLTGNIRIDAGMLELNGSNTFSGDINMSAGSLSLITANALGGNPIEISLGNGNLILNGVSQTIREISGNALASIRNSSNTPAVVTFDIEHNQTFNGTISDSAGTGSLGLTKRGIGMLSLTNDGSDFNGIVRIEEGVLRVDHVGNAFIPSSLGSASSTAASRLVIAGGALSFNNNGPVSTTRSLTIGAGANGAALLAEGPGRESVVNFGFFSPSGLTDSPPVAFEGVGERTFTLGARNDGINTFNLILGDAGAGQPTSVRKIGFGQWALTRQNTFTGLTTVEDGELRVAADGALGAGVTDGGLGTELIGGRLLFNDVNYTTDEDIFFLGGAMQVVGGESTFGGRLVFNRSGTIFVDQGATLTHTGDISGNQTLNFESPGTLILSGTHTPSGINRFVGTVTVREGTLILDYSTNNTSKMQGQLQMGGGRRGGTLVLRGGTHQEIVSQLFLNTGTNRLIREVGSGASIRFNAINNNSSGNFYIDVPGYSSTDRTNTNGIIGSSIIIGDGSGGISWAVNSTNANDGPITPFSSFTANAWNTNLHIDATANSTQAADSTAYTLRFNQPAAPGDVTVNLAGGSNEIQSGGILVTPQMGSNNAIITGLGALSSGTAGLRNTDDLLIMQYNLDADLVISAPITDGAGTDGIEKLGEGRVVILGAHPFTGAIDLAEGEISIDTLANAGVASGIGAGNAGSGNLLFSGGTLTYLGETASTNRAFNVAGPFARFRIGHDRTVATFDGNNAGGERIIKEGAGTMAMTDRSTGILAWEVNEGTVEYYMNGGNNRFGSGIADLYVGGGKLHVIGDPAASRSQQFGGQLTVNAGATTFQVTSTVNPAGDTGRNATFQIQGGDDDYSPIRNAGGSVHFIEDAYVDTSMSVNTVAQILFNIPIPERQRVIPWATYKDTSLTIRPGVNEFATVDSNVGGVDSASSLFLHDIGTLFNDPNNWLADDDVSEAIVGTTTFGLGGIGTLTGDRSVRTIKYFTPEDSLITVPSGNQLTLTQGAILLAYNVRQGVKSIAGDGTISGQMRADDGGRELLVHNYNQSTPFTIGTSIVDSSALLGISFSSGPDDGGTVSQGSPVLEVGFFSDFDFNAVSVGDLVSGPGIVAGTTVIAIDQSNLVIQLSQPASADVVGQEYSFIGKTHFSQAGIGTTILTGANQFNGNTYVNGGSVRLDSAGAIPGGIGSTGGTSALFIDGGVLGLGAGDFSRPLNTTLEGVQLTGSGGFAAYNADRAVNFGGAGAEVEFGRGTFVPSGSSFVLGAHDSTHKVTVINPINIGFQTQMIRVDDGLGAVDGELTGAVRGQGKLLKSGLGTLRFAVANEHAGGTQLAEGSLRAANVANVFGTGPVEIGTSTTHTIPESALNLILEGGAHSNPVTIGNANSTGITTLTSEAATTLSGAVGLGMRTFFESEPGITTTLSGVVSGAPGLVVTSGGQLALANAANAYGTGAGASGSAIDGGTIVRSGSVLVTADGALGGTTVELGDALPAEITVDRAFTLQSVSKLRGEFDATHDGLFTDSGGPGAFIRVSTTIDGHSYTAGDEGKRILVMNEDGDPERNGVYEIVFNTGQPADGTMNLKRTGALDANAELLYGTRVTVTNGTLNGQSFFIGSPGSTVNTSPVHFMADDANPNVSLLAGMSGLTISNSIDVNATNGSGTTTIGADSSVTSGTVTFSGPVTLQDVRAGVQESKTLRVTSSTNSNLGVILSGLLSEADSGMAASDDVLSLLKTGTGTATLTAANTFTGGVTVDQGTLLVNNTTGSGTGSGVVAVNSGATLGGTGTLAGDTTVMGQLRPGSPVVNDGVGTLNFAGDLILGAGSSTFFTLTGNGVNDRFIVAPGSELFVDSTASFVVELGSGYVPMQGDSFNLFDWSALAAGSDTNWDGQITLPNIVSWNLSLLNTQGVISVVPEPGRLGLLVMGLLVLMRRRRR